MWKDVNKLAGFAAVLAALFGVGALAGGVLDPYGDDTAAARDQDHAGDEAMAGHGQPAAAVRGLAVAQDGLRLEIDDPDLRRNRTETVRFRIVDGSGAIVRDFDVEHTKRMHLIVARRDLTGFQHLHPTMAGDGTWSTPLRLSDAGSYRLFADFSHDGKAETLASDLRVDGSATLAELPAPSARAITDGGYTVDFDAAAARAGSEAELAFRVSKDGRPVKVEPYLGAGGHLVALREGDLAFLHVHPDGDDTRFMTTFPTAGRYRLFLQFQVHGQVETVAFTQEVA